MWFYRTEEVYITDGNTKTCLLLDQERRELMYVLYLYCHMHNAYTVLVVDQNGSYLLCMHMNICVDFESTTSYSTSSRTCTSCVLDQDLQKVLKYE